jgi:hypothetical protein
MSSQRRYANDAPTSHNATARHTSRIAKPAINEPRPATHRAICAVLEDAWRRRQSTER